jgi:hypothetical protein
MTICKHCTNSASVLLNNFKIPLCASHFTLLDETNDDVTILNEQLYAEQTELLQCIYRDALSDIAVKMYELQRIEENNNRLKQTAVSSLRNDDKVISRRPEVKASLWRTDLANVDKDQVLKEIEKTELDNMLKRDVSGGASCSSCGSRNTTTRCRHVVESGKSDIWGNKDGDIANSIECVDCGYIQ